MRQLLHRCFPKIAELYLMSPVIYTIYLYMVRHIHHIPHVQFWVKGNASFGFPHTPNNVLNPMRIPIHVINLFPNSNIHRPAWPQRAGHLTSE